MSRGRSGRRWRTLLAGVLLAGAGAAPSRAADDDLEGLPIVRIRCVRYDVFDLDNPKTSSWPYRWTNALHIVTRERLIRSNLLFTEGDAFSQHAAEESARILRSLGFLNPVYITADRLDDGVEVVVETHDQWTLEAGASAGLSGNRSGWSLSFREKNLLGLGKGVKLEYSSDNERDTWATEYSDPNILGTRWQGLLIYEDSSDGDRQKVRLRRPFYSLATSRAWGGEWESERLDEHLYSGGEDAVVGRRSSDAFSLWAGLRLPGDGELVRRLVVGWEARDDEFEDWIRSDSGAPYPVPEDRAISGPRVGVELVSDRFEVLQGFRGFFAQEDVALGPNLSLDLTASAPVFGGDRERYLFDGSVEVAQHRGRWLLLASAWGSGRVESGGLRNLLLGAQLAAAELGTRGWRMRLLVEDGQHLDLDRQLTLGADVGLRGWDPDFFDGTGRALLNVQHRWLVKRDLLQVFSVGVVAFADAGVTWGARVGPSTGGLRADAGVGLVADMTTIGLFNLLRVDVGFPDDGGGPTVTVTGSALF